MTPERGREDQFDLERFVTAQNRVFELVRSELREGRKRGHWMWFIFPQIRGLGYSSMAQYYGISSLDEARAYLRHPVLGPRLIDCTQLVNHTEGSPIQDIFGYPDYLKFHSSMTLFAHATPENQDFLEALAKYFAGRFDSLTVERL